MTCKDWEERIALAAEDDPGAERHLAECAACREKAAAWQRDLNWLKEAHREPIAPSHYAAVRARVLAELEHSRRRVWRQIWAAALSAAAILILFLLFPRTAQTPATVGRAFRPVAALPSGAPAGRPAAARKSRPTLARRAIRKPAPVQHEPLVVKLLTDDPNVIIYWIADRKGE